MGSAKSNIVETNLIPPSSFTALGPGANSHSPFSLTAQMWIWGFAIQNVPLNISAGVASLLISPAPPRINGIICECACLEVNSDNTVFFHVMLQGVRAQNFFNSISFTGALGGPQNLLTANAALDTTTYVDNAVPTILLTDWKWAMPNSYSAGFSPIAFTVT